MASNSDAGASSALDALRRSNDTLRRVVLDNGMVCLIKPDASAPVVSVQIWVGTGSIHENEFLGGGLSHYLEHMLFKGTATRPVGRITKEIDEAGGEINAYTTYDRTVFFCDLPARRWRTGVDVLSDAVMNASLPEEEWRREKEVILREIAMGRDQPGRVLHQLLFSTAYRQSPLRNPVIGVEEIFKTMTRDNLTSYYKRRYTPDNMIAVVVGDVKPDEVEAHLRETFKDFHRRAAAPVIVPKEEAQAASREVRQTGAYNVTRAILGYHAVPFQHADAPALDLLAMVAGQGRSARLNEELKERQRLVHDVDAFNFNSREEGLFGVSATFEPEKESAVIAALDKAVAGLKDTRFGDAELAKAKKQLLVSSLSSLTTTHGQAAAYGSGEFHAGNPRYTEQYLADVERITADDLRRVAGRYLTPANRTLAVLAPTSSVATASTVDTIPAANAPVRRTLKNGVPLIVREDHRLPFVHVSLVFGGGLLAETEADNGVTQLAADLLTRGAGSRSAEEIAREIEGLGASLGTFAGRNTFGLNASCLSSDLDTMGRIMADCVCRPTFPVEELDKQREVQIAALKQQREQPMQAGMEALRTVMFPGHPYRLDPSGSEVALGHLTRDDVMAHYRRLAVNGNASIAVFGDITQERAADLAELVAGRLPTGAAPVFTNTVPGATLPARREIPQPKTQAIVLTGYRGLDVRDPRIEAARVIDRAMSGLSSDLAIEIRDKRGLAYYSGASQFNGLQTGLFFFYCGTHAAAAAEVERLMSAEIRRVAEHGLREEEWKRAKEQLLAEHDMGLQDNGGLAQECAVNELLGLGFDRTFKQPVRIAAVDGDAVRNTAAALFKPGAEATMIVMPAAQGEKR